jgi:hypothetical protein
MKIQTDTVVLEAAYDPKHIKTPTQFKLNKNIN